MRLANLDTNLIGKRLSNSIKTLDGRNLIKGNIEISEKLIQRLKVFGMSTVYIEDPNINLELKETIPEEKRAEIYTSLNSMYQSISSSNSFDEFELGKLIRMEILPEISNEPVSLPIGRTVKGYDITQHSLNVCLLAIVTAQQLGLGVEKIITLAKAALLHDIGKLIKNNSDEGHEIIGYEFLKNRTHSLVLYNLVRFHHETLDEKGPQRLKAENQNEMIRILSLCNSYEYMFSQLGLIPSECFERIQADVHVKYDAEVFDAFRKSIYVYPLGLPVELNNGEEGTVVRQNKAFPSRPFVRCNDREYNLMEHLSIFIERVAL